MGDTPDIVKKHRYCPNTPWIDGKVPEVISLGIFGMLKGALWNPFQGEPPNGFYTLRDHVYNEYGERVDLYCGMYAGLTAHGFGITASFGPSMGSITMYGYPDTVFHGEDYFSATMSSTNLVSNPEESFYGGYAYWFPYPGPTDRLKSWDIADAVGVPKSPGYYAEEMITYLATRKVRYSNHANGTNVKVYFNE